MSDVHSGACCRLAPSERARMKTLLDEYEVEPGNVQDGRHRYYSLEKRPNFILKSTFPAYFFRLSTKKNIIDMAKEFQLYFAR